MNDRLPIAGALNPYRTPTITEWTTREAPRNPYPADYVVAKRGLTYRGFKIERELMGPLHWEIISTEQEKPTPRVLQGKYTNLTRAKEAIDQYLETVTKKEEKSESEA
jgi:hypothetical protein